MGESLFRGSVKSGTLRMTGDAIGEWRLVPLYDAGRLLEVVCGVTGVLVISGELL